VLVIAWRVQLEKLPWLAESERVRSENQEPGTAGRAGASTSTVVHDHDHDDVHDNVSRRRNITFPRYYV
jgi:hypothetical protein